MNSSWQPIFDRHCLSMNTRLEKMLYTSMLPATIQI